MAAQPSNSNFAVGAAAALLVVRGTVLAEWGFRCDRRQDHSVG